MRAQRQAAGPRAHAVRTALSMVLVVAALCVAAPAHADAPADYAAGVAAHARGDVVTAMAMLRRAADAGHVPAMVRLAYLLDKAEENEAAFALYKRAADAGSSAAELALGVMYAAGEGVAADRGKALQWMSRAAGQRYGPALVTLARVYAQGDLGVTPDRAEARRLLELGAAAGYAPALQELTRLQDAATDGSSR